jgi:hypothetical protein
MAHLAGGGLGLGAALALQLLRAPQRRLNAVYLVLGQDGWPLGNGGWADATRLRCKTHRPTEQINSNALFHSRMLAHLHAMCKRAN